MADVPAWPGDREDLAGLSEWVGSVLPGAPVVRGPVEVLRVKTWGATAIFEADGERVVVKHTAPVLYPRAAALHRMVQRVCPKATAALLAHVDDPAWQRSVFSHVPGPTVEKAGPASLVRQARTLGELQGALAGADLDDLPAYDLTAVPETLLADLNRTGDLDEELVAELGRNVPELRHGIEELSAAVPISIDHPDVQGTNGIVRDDGSVVLLDWEEARVGCPMLSLDRLLQEADELGNTSEVLTGYLDAVPWGNTTEKRRLAGVALRLAPLKLAIEAREYARALGLPHPHTRYTSALVTRSLSRLRGEAEPP